MLLRAAQHAACIVSSTPTPPSPTPRGAFHWVAGIYILGVLLMTMYRVGRACRLQS